MRLIYSFWGGMAEREATDIVPLQKPGPSDSLSQPEILFFTRAVAPTMTASLGGHMLRILIDTCVWLDIAKDYRHLKTLGRRLISEPEPY